MGRFGDEVHQFNFRFFGALSYLYPFGLIYLAYLLYRQGRFTLRLAEIYIASIFFTMLLLVLQTLSFGLGVFGEAIISFLLPYLGVFGIWSLSLLGIGICLISFCNTDIVQLGQTYIPRLGRLLGYLFESTIAGLDRLYTFGKQITASCIKNLAKLKISFKPKATTEAEDLSLLELSQDPQIDLQNLLPNTPDDNPIEITKQAPQDQPLPPQKESIVNDKKITIQEVIVAMPKEREKTQIRVVDRMTPPKENPFLKNQVSLEQGGKISTSAELMKKIRNQNNPTAPSSSNSSESQNTQIPITPHKSTSFHLDKSDPLPTYSPTISSDDTPHPSSHIHQKISDPSPIEKSNFVPNAPLTTLDQESMPTNLLDSQEFSQDLEPSFQNPIEAPSESPLETPIETPNLITPESQDTHPTQESPHTPTKPPLQASSTPITPQASHSTFAKKTTHIKSLEENEALLKEIDQGDVVIPKDYKLPPISLLSPAPAQENEIDESEIDLKIQSLLTKLAVFKIEGDVIRTYSGPIITTLEFRPAPNVKVSRIQSLENDIAMALEAKSIRIQAPIPGKNVVGIEIPNSTTQTIYLREIFESEIFQNSASPLTLALGKDVVGNPFITDLKKLPHLLIAGTTGSGKSVGVNAMILSLLYRNSPDDLKLMMVDPKMVEFMPYSDLPHLITPIITDPKKAVIGLANAVKEMERRYTLMSQSRTKEIVSYNQKAEELGLEKFPYFVIIIDELADLMMTAGREVEYSMARIAQMGRASGIHLIVATQSPRAEVLTGLIKTNLPAHLSYKVGTKIDAGIIGCAGAETLLGRGDMLFTPPGVSGLVRLHAPWSSEDEVNEIIAFIKEQREVIYDPQFLPEEREALGAMDCELDEEMASLVNKAHQIILQDGKTSISYLQRRLSIGYNKAATIVEKLGEMGILSEPDAKGNRQIL